VRKVLGRVPTPLKLLQTIVKYTRQTSV